MTAEQLDSLCLAMADEIRSNTLKETASSTENIDILQKHDFLQYLHNTYCSNGKKTHTACQKQLKEGTLLRLAEGKLTIEEAEDFRKNRYRTPTSMVESEYFFLNGKLVKISLTIGRTDYNALPKNYWIMVKQIDFVYPPEDFEKRTIYHVGSVIHPSIHSLFPTNVMSSDEWREQEMEGTGITEKQLQIKAFQLHNLYTLNKKPFGQ